MPSKEEIAQQLELLATYRRTLAHYLRQQAQLGEEYTPPGVTHGIHQTRMNIKRSKAILHDWGVDFEEHPDDEEPPVSKRISPRKYSAHSAISSNRVFVTIGICASFILIVVFITGQSNMTGLISYFRCGGVTSGQGLTRNGRLFIHDDINKLDMERVKQAADVLVNRGAIIALYNMRSGNYDDFMAQLEKDGLRKNNLVKSDLIAIYTACTTRFNSMYYGGKWEEILGPTETVRTEALKPEFMKGNYTDAFVNALSRIAQIVSTSNHK